MSKDDNKKLGDSKPLKGELGANVSKDPPPNLDKTDILPPPKPTAPTRSRCI